MKPQTCFVPDCPHRHEDGWAHVVPLRRTVVTAHLRDRRAA